MAGASFFALLDDIATLLDDVAAMSKVAIHKTAGVLGDDLALNAKQVTGFDAKRELPVIGRIALGSAINKLILIPAALLLSVLTPWAILPLLMIGGIYLCYEGVEKLFHAWLHRSEAEHEERKQAISDPDVDMVSFERTRIRAAIRTDFILSAEIVVIALGIIRSEPLMVRIGVLSAVGVVMTVGVYGLVSAIVKIDDLGLHLASRKGATLYDRSMQRLGEGLIIFAPWLLRFLSVAGTIAMFLVGGGIVTHNVDWLHHISESITHAVSEVPLIGTLAWALGGHIFDTLFGIAAGAVALVVVSAAQRLFSVVSGGNAAPHSDSH